VTWKVGPAASHVLEEYLESGPDDPQLPRMPVGMAEVLRKCLSDEPNGRCASMAEVAEGLRRVYQREIRRHHPRPRPDVTRQENRLAVPHDRRTTAGFQWSDPRDWLVKALKAGGRDPGEAKRLLPSGGGSRKAQAISDLAAYEEARRLYTRLIASGRRDLETDLARLCMEKAFIHENADDRPGALALYDQTIAVLERLVNQEGRHELANQLAVAYMFKGNAVSALGDHRAAVTMYERCNAIYERLVNQEGRCELANQLAAMYLNSANAARELGEMRTAVTLQEKGIAILERLVNQEGRRELASELATGYVGKALAVSDLGDKRAAVALYQQGIAILERLVNREGLRELANQLA
jgi:tetratricopeptide (TPR) repeat protein